MAILQYVFVVKLLVFCNSCWTKKLTQYVNSEVFYHAHTICCVRYANTGLNRCDSKLNTKFTDTDIPISRAR